MKHYECVNGLLQPAPPRGHNKPALTYLPCAATKKLVHAWYARAGGKVANTTFVKLRNLHCITIVTMGPKEEVCCKCADWQSIRHQQSKNGINLKITDAPRVHIMEAKSARDKNRNPIARAIQTKNDQLPNQQP